MKTILQSIKIIFANPKYIIGFLILVAIFAGIWYLFTDFNLMKGNY